MLWGKKEAEEETDTSVAGVGGVRRKTRLEKN